MSTVISGTVSCIPTTTGSNPSEDMSNTNTMLKNLHSEALPNTSLDDSPFFKKPPTSVTFDSPFKMVSSCNSFDIGRESMPFNVKDFCNTSSAAARETSFCPDKRSEEMKNSYSEALLNATLDKINSPFFKIPSSLTFDSPFKRLSTSFDIGKESLPFNWKDADSFNLSRPSIGGNTSFDIGKESLGILHIKSPDLNYGLTSELTIPTIMLNGSNEFEASNNCKSSPSSVLSCLNAAFILPHSSRESVSSISSGSLVNPTFSSKTFNSTELSRIYSLPSSSTKGFERSSLIRPDKLNDAFSDTTSFMKQLGFSASTSVSSVSSLLPGSSAVISEKIKNTPELSAFRSRILSLPAPVKLQDKLDGSCTRQDRKFWSAEKVKKKATVARRSFCEALTFDEEEEEDANFNDSVFMEANYIASKIADGSIAEAAPLDNLLDSTSPPELCTSDEEDANEEPPPKPDTKSVFKAIDKMVPPVCNPAIDLLFSTKSRNKNNTSGASNTSNASNKFVNENSSKISQVSNSENCSTDTNLSKSNRSKNTRDILQDLSKILNSTNRSDSVKTEGQNLLHSLADILNQSAEVNRRSNSMEDSGHSSIVLDAEITEENKNECFEVLDLRTSKSISDSEDTAKCSVSQDNPVVLDLSMKSKTNEAVNRRLSQSFGFASPKILPVKFNASVRSGSSFDNSKNSKTRSISSNDSQLSSAGQNSSRTSLSNFKLKKAEEKIFLSKKGPLKAVMPVGDMVRQTNKPTNESQKSTRLSVPVVSSARQGSKSANGTPKSSLLSVIGNIRKRQSQHSAVSGLLKNSNTVETSTNTPSRQSENKSTSIFQSKRTSTPISHQSKLKPVAQSTPDGASERLRSSSFSVQKKNYDTNASPIARPNSKISNAADKKRAGSAFARYSCSSLPTSSLPISRRSSVSEIKKQVERSMSTQRRSSIGKESGIMSALSRVRENITKSTYYKSNISHNGKLNNSGGGKTMKYTGLSENLKGAKTVNPVNNLQKAGKENKDFQ